MKDVINIINRALKNYLSESLTSLMENEITLQMPKKKWVDSPESSYPKMSLYLFDVQENLSFRENRWQQVDYDKETIREKKPNIYIDLFYVITFYSQSENQNNIDETIIEEHQWISELIAKVYNRASIPKKYFLDESEIKISNMPNISLEAIRPKFLNDEGGFQLWSAIDQYLKPAIYLKITTPIELSKYIDYAKVQAKILKFGTLETKNYYTINIHPTLKSLVSQNKSVHFEKIEKSNTIKKLYKNTNDGAKKVLVSIEDNIEVNEYFIIETNQDCELCHVTKSTLKNNKIHLTLEKPLNNSYTKNQELTIVKIVALNNLNLIEDIQDGSNQLKLIGDDIKQIKKGSLLKISIDNTYKCTYITEIFKEQVEIKDILETKY